MEEAQKTNKNLKSRITLKMGTTFRPITLVMTSVIESYGLPKDVFKHLRIRDIYSLRAASTYFMWTVDGLYESEMRTLALKFGILAYKRDVTLEKEIRSLLMGFLRLKEQESALDLIHQDIYVLFDRLQRAPPQDLHLPRLTLKTLRLRNTLTLRQGGGIIRKILREPRLYRKSLKHITRMIYRIPRRIDLRMTLQYELGLDYEELKPLLKYELECILMSQMKTALIFFPKVSVFFFVMVKVLQIVCGDSIEAVEGYIYLLGVVYALLVGYRFCIQTEQRFESFLD